MNNSPQDALERIVESPKTWVLLDYDGTLKPFERTPDILSPDPILRDLLNDLVRRPHISVAVISGRRLGDLQILLPIPGLWIAGVYGFEWQAPDGEPVTHDDDPALRSALEKIKARWEGLIAAEKGQPFFLEDKGFSVALHARFVEDALAGKVLKAARQAAERSLEKSNSGWVVEGDKFLEVRPEQAQKSHAVEMLIDRHADENALLVYVGDDDNDEKAFEVIHARQGIAARVTDEPEKTRADFCFESTDQVRAWLKEINLRVPPIAY